ncbi:MAG: hypothetical protein H7Z37_05040, partial [Pyrinomonadaceae bacterium]|nr:hypothetical protein [Pyrinomonadaceae bacterium]
MNEQPEITIKISEAADLPQIIEIARESSLSNWKTNDYLEELNHHNSIFFTAARQTEI